MADQDSAAAVPRVLRSAVGSKMRLIDAGRIGTTGTALVKRPFYVDERPVSRDEFDAFCRATGRDLRKRRLLERGSAPFAPVLWEDAAAYAAWAGKRLPTSLEWRLAFQERFGTGARRARPLPAEWVLTPGAQRAAQACSVFDEDRITVFDPGADTWAVGVGFRCALDVPEASATKPQAPPPAPTALRFSDRVGDVFVLPAGALGERLPLAPGLRHGVRFAASQHVELVEVRWLTADREQGWIAGTIEQAAGPQAPVGPRDAFVVGRLPSATGFVVARRGWPGLPLSALVSRGEERLPVDVVCRLVSDVMPALLRWHSLPCGIEATSDGELAVVPWIGEPLSHPMDEPGRRPGNHDQAMSAAAIWWWLLTGGPAPQVQQVDGPWAPELPDVPRELLEALLKASNAWASRRLRADQLAAVLLAHAGEREPARAFLRGLVLERAGAAAGEVELIREELGVLPTDVELRWQLD